MIIVVQCAGTKQPTAGHLRTMDGKKVMFVAHPESAPDTPHILYAHPDGPSDQFGTWRDVLQRHNKEEVDNDWSLLPALDLYSNNVYAQLAKQVGYQKSFILSAGWGLVRGDYLLPSYDITFSRSADTYKKRGTMDVYRDFHMLTDDTDEPIYFFGGKDYVPLFCELTRSARGLRTVFFNSRTQPNAPGCQLEQVTTSARTNWHYSCIKRFIDSHPRVS